MILFIPTICWLTVASLLVLMICNVVSISTRDSDLGRMGRTSSYLGVNTVKEIQEKDASIRNSRLLTRPIVGAHNIDTQGDSISLKIEMQPMEQFDSPVYSVDITIESQEQMISSQDSIGVWCVDDQTSLLDFISMKVAEIDKSKKIAKINNIRFHHIRCPLLLKYITSSSDLVEGSAANLLVRDHLFPYHPRIAYGPDPMTQMWISWTSDSNQSKPFVRVGTDSGSYDRIIYGEGWTSYYPNDMCGSPANTSSVFYYMFPGYFANVLLTGLEPETIYYAVYGSDDSYLSSEVSFSTGRPIGRDVSVRLAAYGDMALSVMGALTTIEQIVSLHEDTEDSGGIDAILHFGDLGYAFGSTVIWDVWHQYIHQASKQIPYLVSVGNHEMDHATQSCPQEPSGANPGPDYTGFHPAWGDYGDDSNGEGGVPTYHRFRGPGNGAESLGILPVGNAIYWYSFSVGSIHVLQLSSEHDFTKGSKQYRWIEADLKAVDKSLTPWTVVTFHRPMMTPEAGSQFNVSVGMILNLEPMFIRYGVDLVLGGHIHAYTRCCPMVQWVCTPRSEGGITYVTVGTAGATVHNETMVDRAEEWIESWRVEWGFGVITSVNSTALHWEFRSDKEKKIVDEVWIHK